MTACPASCIAVASGSSQTTKSRHKLSIGRRHDRGVTSLIFEQVTVEVDRDRHGRMPHPAGQALQVHILPDPAAGAGVTKVVHPVFVFVDPAPGAVFPLRLHRQAGANKYRLPTVLA